LPLDKVEDIAIYGYCDDRGSDAYNQALSQRRADAIKSEFVEKGVADSIITNADGKGELLLTRLDDVTNEVQRTLNRKVEIIVSLKQPPKPKVDSSVVIKEEVVVEIPPRYKTYTDAGEHPV